MSNYAVKVVPYQSAWVDLFQQEARAIAQILGNNMVFIHHVGSTSIPGLVAKPIIDIMPVVADITAIDLLTDQFEALGYEAMGEFGLPGRRFFRKGGFHRTHHLHCYQVGNREIERHLAFADYLRSYPNVAAQYGALKSHLARKFPENIDRYMDGKHAFIQETEQSALSWWDKVPVLLITGSVGVGKSTVAERVSELLKMLTIPHWLMNIDSLTDLFPRSVGDPFATGASLAMIKESFKVARACGSRLVILPRVLEDKTDIDATMQIIPGAIPWIVRLEATLETIDQRLEKRETGEGLLWHKQRARVLVPKMEAGGLGDLVLSTDAQNPQQLAEQIVNGFKIRFAIEFP